MNQPSTQQTDRLFLTIEDINSLDVIVFNGIIHYIDSDAKLNSLIFPTDTYVGFDTETKPSFKKNIINPLSLIQIATETDAYLFHLKKIKNKEKIFMFLSNNNIIKIGSGISDDIKKINKLSKFQINKDSFIDIQSIAKKMNLPKSNLKFLTAYFLNKRIIKSSQTSNWDQHPLTPKQIQYAATDAWICLKIYQKIQNIYFKTD